MAVRGLAEQGGRPASSRPWRRATQAAVTSAVCRACALRLGPAAGQSGSTDSLTARTARRRRRPGASRPGIAIYEDGARTTGKDRRPKPGRAGRQPGLDGNSCAGRRRQESREKRPGSGARACTKASQDVRRHKSWLHDAPQSDRRRKEVRGRLRARRPSAASRRSEALPEGGP
jgi:hypothetical protein